MYDEIKLGFNHIKKRTFELQGVYEINTHGNFSIKKQHATEIEVNP